MAGIVPVIDTQGGGMGDQDIQITAMPEAVPDQGGDQPDNLQIHLEIAELVLTFVVAQ